MSSIITVDNLATAIKLINQAYPVVMAAIEYLQKAGITDEDIAKLKAQDMAAADNQQEAIEKRKEREEV